MNRNVIIWTVAGFLVVIVLIPLVAGRGDREATETTPSTSAAPTSLHEAARDGKLDSVQRLLSGGADPNAPDDQGKTPLHWAAANGHLQTTVALLEGGANVNVRDAQGKTPLDYARSNGHDGTARELAASAGQSRAGPTPGMAGREPGAASAGPPKAQGLNPSLKHPDLPSFERAIASPWTASTASPDSNSSSFSEATASPSRATSSPFTPPIRVGTAA